MKAERFSAASKSRRMQNATKPAADIDAIPRPNQWIQPIGINTKEKVNRPPTASAVLGVEANVAGR